MNYSFTTASSDGAVSVAGQLCFPFLANTVLPTVTCALICVHGPHACRDSEPCTHVQASRSLDFACVIVQQLRLAHLILPPLELIKRWRGQGLLPSQGRSPLPRALVRTSLQKLWDSNLSVVPPPHRVLARQQGYRSHQWVPQITRTRSDVHLNQDQDSEAYKALWPPSSSGKPDRRFRSSNPEVRT